MSITGKGPVQQQALHTKANTWLLFLKSEKGTNSVKSPDKVMALIHTVALVKVKKCVKFGDSSFNSMEVVSRISFSVCNGA